MEPPVAIRITTPVNLATFLAMTRSIAEVCDEIELHVVDGELIIADPALLPE